MQRRSEENKRTGSTSHPLKFKCNHFFCLCVYCQQQMEQNGPATMCDGNVDQGQKSEGSNGNSGLLMTWASPPASWYFVGEDQGITASGETDMKVSWHGLHI